MIAVVIPTLREYQNLGMLIPSVLAQLHETDLMVIIDAETDMNLWKDVGFSEHPQVRFRQQKGLGLGSALKQGIEYAVSLDADKIITMDADLSHNPLYFKQLINLSESNEVVVGSRYVEGGSFNGSPYRTAVSTIANFLLKNIFRSKVQDLTSGYRLYEANLFKGNILDNVNNHYGFQFEVLINLERNNIAIAEAPIVFLSRNYGKTKFNFRTLLNSFWVLVRMLKKNIIKPRIS